jgi:hypothetical protein
MMKAGLLAACLGAALLALSSFRGVVTGFVGTTVWSHPGWRMANLVGWLLLIGGFLLQYVSVRRAPPSTQPTRTVEALLNVLERKGVITTAEVLEESARLGKKSVTGR